MRHRRRRALAPWRPSAGLPALLATLAAAAPASAQLPGTELDTLVVEVGSRVSAAAAGTRSVDVLDAARLATLPVRTVGEALRWAAGVDVQRRSPAQSDLSIRGGGFEQVLVLVDGLRVSDAQTGHFDLDLTVPLEQVERIEVLRGPAAALFGADAMGGVVNVVTRAPGGPVAGRVEAGSRATALASARGGAGRRGLGVSGGLEHARSDGHRDGTDYRVTLGHVRAALHVGPGRLTLSGGHARRDFGADAFYAPHASWEETRTTLVAASWKGALGGGWTLEPRVSVRRHDDDFVLRRNDPAFYRNVHRSVAAGGGMVGRWRATGSPASLAIGWEAYRDDLRSSSLGDRTEDREAVFAEAAWSAAAASVVAGARLDRHEGFGFAFSPSLSASFRPSPGLRLRSAVGRSFRAPTFTERYYVDPEHEARDDLAPERAWTAEVGADAALPEGGLLQVTAFRRWSADLVDWARSSENAGTPWQTRNVKRATFSGLEVDLTGLEVAGATLHAAGSLLALEARDAEGLFSKYALRPLVQQATAGVARALPGGVRLGAHVLHRAREGDPAHTLVELRASVEAPLGRVYVDVANLTDTDYHDVTGHPGPGRAFSVGWRYEE